MPGISKTAAGSWDTTERYPDADWPQAKLDRGRSADLASELQDSPKARRALTNTGSVSPGRVRELTQTQDRLVQKAASPPSHAEAIGRSCPLPPNPELAAHRARLKDIERIKIDSRIQQRLISFGCHGVGFMSDLKPLVGVAASLHPSLQLDAFVGLANQLSVASEDDVSISDVYDAFLCRSKGMSERDQDLLLFALTAITRRLDLSPDLTQALLNKCQAEGFKLDLPIFHPCPGKLILDEDGLISVERSGPPAAPPPLRPPLDAAAWHRHLLPHGPDTQPTRPR